MAQPGAQIGQQVHCPVSGVVFEVTASSTKVEVDGQPIYVCCPACAEYFTKNRDRVLAVRDMAPSTSTISRD